MQAGTRGASSAEREAERIAEERHRASLLRARVQPRSPVRAFDVAALRPRPSISAEAELQALLLDLRRAREHHQRGAYWVSERDAVEAAQRMALFRWRFGVAPEQVAGWSAVALEAGDLLAEAERNPERTKPCSFCINDKDSDSSLFHALLLELAGRTVEADERLAGTEVRGYCGNCMDVDEQIIRQRRSEAAARRGELDRALAILTPNGERTSYWGRVDDLLVTDAHDDGWWGMLLLANGRADDGVLVLQQVVDLFPRSAAADVARAALEQVGAFVEPSAKRLLDVYIDPFEADARDDEPGSGWHRPFAIRAFGAYRSAGAFDRLNVWFDTDPESAIEGMILLRDERARSVFELQLEVCELDDVELPLRGLASTKGGLAPYVERVLAKLAAAGADEGGINVAGIDDLLRSACGDGPAFDELHEVDYRPFAMAWRDWIAANSRPR